MKDIVATLVFGTCVLGGLWVAYRLVIAGHPWFALLILAIVGSIHVKVD